MKVPLSEVLLPLSDEAAQYLLQVFHAHHPVWNDVCALCRVADCRWYVDAEADLVLAGRIAGRRPKWHMAELDAMAIDGHALHG